MSNKPNELVVTMIDPYQLKNHPLNAKIYGDVADDEMVESVKQVGIKQPILCTPADVVVSGHRRMQAARKAGLTEVPIVYLNDLTDEHDIQMALIHANKQREKTSEQKAREFKILKEIEAKRAKERQATSTGGREPQLMKNLSGAEKRSEETIGAAREIAADKMGWSGPTAEKAAEVVDEIDRAETSGEAQKAEHLRETLNNKSVSAAHRALKHSDDPPKRRTKPTREFYNRKVRFKEFIDAYKHLGGLLRAMDDIKNNLGNEGRHYATECRNALDDVLHWLEFWEQDCEDAS